jgi:hypothetical protein
VFGEVLWSPGAGSAPLQILMDKIVP